jgi:hypothetical protein
MTLTVDTQPRAPLVYTVTFTTPNGGMGLWKVLARSLANAIDSAREIIPAGCVIGPVYKEGEW